MSIDHFSHVWMEAAQSVDQESAEDRGPDREAQYVSSRGTGANGAGKAADWSRRSAAGARLQSDPPSETTLSRVTRLRLQAAIAALAHDGTVARAVAGEIGSAKATAPRPPRARWSRAWPVAANGGWPDFPPEE